MLNHYATRAQKKKDKKTSSPAMTISKYTSNTMEIKSSSYCLQQCHCLCCAIFEEPLPYIEVTRAPLTLLAIDQTLFHGHIVPWPHCSMAKITNHDTLCRHLYHRTGRLSRTMATLLCLFSAMNPAHPILEHSVASFTFPDHPSSLSFYQQSSLHIAHCFKTFRTINPPKHHPEIHTLHDGRNQQNSSIRGHGSRPTRGPSIPYRSVQRWYR